MELAGLLSNPRRLLELSQIVGDARRAGDRPRAVLSEGGGRQRRVGELRPAVIRLLEAAGGPMRLRDIHTALELDLGEPVPRSTIKNLLAVHCRGATPVFERRQRGLYQLAAVQR